MRGLELPHRRYSMPETIMRKFRLGRSSSTSSSEGSVSSRRVVGRRRRSRVSRACQTSPKLEWPPSPVPVLLDSSPSLDLGERRLNIRRSSSVPDLSSSLTSTPDKLFMRPVSTSEELGGERGSVDSTCVVDQCADRCKTNRGTRVSPSCMVQPEQPFPLCCESGSYPSSDCTLSQTVSDRTTSTQDSTLSVTSTTPSLTPVPITPEGAMMLERSIFSPAGQFIAVHTESILIRPLNIIDSTDNWNYGFSPDDLETQMTLMPQSVGTITEDDIGAITSGRKDQSTSIDEIRGEEKPSRHVDIGMQIGIINVGVQVEDPTKTIGGRTGDLTSRKTTPRVKIFKTVPPESGRGIGMGEQNLVVRSQSTEEQTKRVLTRDQETQSLPPFKTSKSYPPAHKGQRKFSATDVGCSGGNYKDIEEADSIIARFSAVPRTNSMVVNTSSVDYSSDSDVSLTDSLEDGDRESRKCVWPESRHDSRLVRGEVALDTAPRYRKSRCSKDTYAYFLSLTGEQDLIKQYTIPEWLRERLKKREQEIKKIISTKLNRSRTVVFRQRRKNIKQLEHFNDLNNSKKMEASRETIVGIVQEIPSNTIKPVEEIAVEAPNSSNNKYVHISEVIKIEMSNSIKTVITKEKQINMSRDAFIKDGNSVQTSEFINNVDSDNIQKIIMKTNIGNFHLEDNNTIIDLQTPMKIPGQAYGNSQNVEETTSKQPPTLEGTSSWKKLCPIFHSKADDKTVAHVLLAALEDNNSDNLGGETTGENLQAALPSVEKSINTDGRHLTESIQTNDSYLTSSTTMQDKSEQSDLPPHTEILMRDNKGVNTTSFSVSTLVQTRETFLEEQQSLTEVDKGTEIFEDSKVDKSCNTMNPLTNTSAQTDSVNEVKPFNQEQKKITKAVSKNSTVTFSDKTKRDTPTPYCKRNESQILELNVPPCTCHFCTFHSKKQLPEKQQGKPFGRAAVGNVPPSKILPPGLKRGSGRRFQRGKFEAIPEERGSMELAGPEGSAFVDASLQTGTSAISKQENKATMTNQPNETEERKQIDQAIQKNSVQTGSTQTVTPSPSAKKKNIVIGRFKAIDNVPDKSLVNGHLQLGEGIDVVRQYKGRAALATTTHEELLTLSKGWINFYLLKDSTEMSDSNNDEDIDNGITSTTREEVQAYTVEIEASPEPEVSTRFPSLLSSNSAKEQRKKSKVRHNHLYLPDIVSSSSSSTPDTIEPKRKQVQKGTQQMLPEVNRERKSRHEIRARREQVTSIEKKIAKSEPLLKLPKDFSENGLPKAVEVARSEHSVSSITSSTVFLSESPSPQQLTFPEKTSSNKKQHRDQNGIGSNWTVTIAGSSGFSNQSPPDVEMKLSFGNTQSRAARGVMQYQSHHHVRSNRQGAARKMIEEYKHSLRNERHSLQYVPEVQYDQSHSSKRDHKNGLMADEEHYIDYDQLNFSDHLRAKSVLSEEGDLQVTGLAITPELKPRVPTQSERDLVRRQRYKFTR